MLGASAICGPVAEVARLLFSYLIGSSNKQRLRRPEFLQVRGSAGFEVTVVCEKQKSHDFCYKTSAAIRAKKKHATLSSGAQRRVSGRSNYQMRLD